MDTTKKEHLKKLYNHLAFYNRMAPFPPYDSDYVAKVKEELDSMKADKEYYDSLPVVACKYCKSLHIIVDENDNDICLRCNTINELESFKNIYEYNKYLKKYEETE